VRVASIAILAALFSGALGCGSDSVARNTSADDTTDDTGTSGKEDGGTTPRKKGTITVGEKTRILISGTVMLPSGPITGEVLVDGAQIACVGKKGECAAEAEGATVIKTSDVISPGLIDTHNHILYDIFDDSDWAPAMSYANHNEWPKEARYSEMVDVKQCLEDASQGKPTWCPAAYDGTGNLKCEMNKWGELKGLIAGTTSIVGLPGLELQCYSTIARSIDTRFNGLDADSVQASALTPPSRSTADGVCNNFASGKTKAYLIHCGEGVDDVALGEFEKLSSAPTTAGCLIAEQTTITHGTAFTKTQFEAMKAAGMKLTWSPASNIALYGATTNIPLAVDTGVLVSLAPDWSMGGSQNMLDELRFADEWDNKNWDNKFAAKDIFEMATSNAAVVLALQDKIGKIEKGAMADLVIFRKLADDPYESILKATPADVDLTMVGGKVLYGDAAFKEIGNSAPEEISICGEDKFLAITEDASVAQKADQTYTQIKELLEQAMKDMDAVRPGGGNPFSPVAPLVACAKK